MPTRRATFSPKARRAAACVTALAVLGFGLPATALDYDRNDVLGREISLLGVVGPVDNHPVGLAVRGTARRHVDWFYRSLAFEVGGLSDVRPWLMISGAVGGESATDSWTAFRGYVEGGVAMLYAATELTQTLAFFTEAGVRYQVRYFERPHLQVHIGTRFMHNFSNYGLSVLTGVAWTFD